MTDFVQFLGRLHPIAVHLPIGIFLLLALIEVVGWIGRRRHLAALPSLDAGQRALILTVGAFAALAAAAFGWVLGNEGGYDPELLALHRILGLATAAGAVLLAFLARRPVVYRAGLPLLLVVLTFAAHWGGMITHGADYLFPAASVPPPKVATTAPAGKAKAAASLATATVFADVIHPILHERCENCHGPTQTKGGLRLDSWEALTRGGKHGPVLARDPAASLLGQRVDAPIDAKGHMPPADKPQLAADDLTLLDWWVASGGLHNERVTALDLPPAVEDILSARLGGGTGEGLPERAAVLQIAEELEHDLHILVRPLGPEGPWLDVNARPAGHGFDDAALARLQPIAGAVQWLDLGTTAVTSEGLAALGSMRQLQRLHLDLTAVDDDGLGRLKGLKHLQYLNLRGTRVTDTGLVALRELPRLRELFVWQTAVTDGAVKALGAALVDQRRIARWRTEQGELDRQIRAEQFAGSLGETFPPDPKPADDTKKSAP